MKDPGGHGSNSRLTSTQGPTPAVPHVKPLAPGARNPGLIHGGQPMSSNAQAAQALMSTLKSTQAPIHPAMVGRPSPDGGSAS